MRTVGIIGTAEDVARFAASPEGQHTAREIAEAIFADDGDVLAAYEGGEGLRVHDAFATPVAKHLDQFIAQRNRRWDAQEGSDIS